MSIYEVNRSVAVVKPRQLFLDWLKSLPGDDISDLTVDNLRVDCLTLMVPEYEEPEEAIAFLDEHFQEVFRLELASWEEDEKLWPEKLTLAMFWEWFDVELHSLVLDFLDEELENQEILP